MKSTIEELINKDLNRRDFLKRVAIVAGGWRWPVLYRRS